MKVNSIVRVGVFACASLLVGSLTFSATPLQAEPLPSTFQQPGIKQSSDVLSAAGTSASGTLGEALAAPLGAKEVAVPATSYVATAYCLRGRTATGIAPSKGIIAADPRILPLGSRVRLEAGPYSGEYLVADTGSLVRGRRIDVWTPTVREALRFGRRTIKLTVLSFGGKRKAPKPSVTKIPTSSIN